MNNPSHKRRIESKALSIGELLRRPFTYKVPVHQRDFSWTSDEVDSLWQDLVTALEEGRSDYFLGAIVLAPSATDPSILEIVDGQQRLAALTMILSAIHKCWKDRGDDSQATELQRDYLGSRDRRTRELVPKLTLNETNDPVFQSIVLKGEEAGISARKTWPKSNRLLYDAFTRIKTHLSGQLAKDEPEEALIDLEKYIAGSANVIAIEVGDDYDAFVIFETLNDRGLELAVSDLVKNYLFSLAEERLESFKKAWSDTALLIGSENLTPFLRHLWLSEYHFVRERDLYRSLREKVNSRIAARQFVDRLRKAADLYSALLNVDSPYWTDGSEEARKALHTLRLFRVAQFRPLALAVMEGADSSEVAKMLRIVSTITFRYTIISGYNANELERVYSAAALAVRKGGRRNPKFIFEQLKSVYVDDRRFQDAFQSASFSRAELARYVLSELNSQMESDKAVSIDEDKISLEHVLPKNPGQAWKGALPRDAEPSDWIEAIGNLTLLEKAVNRGLANKDFATKKTKGYSRSKLPINSDIATMSRWTHAEISDRGAALAGIAVKRWRLDY
jgi:hypothetical protein